MGRVSGKVVVVTGAAGGQGAAEAVALAAEGATVIATDVHDEIDAADGVAYRKLDVSEPGDWRALGEWLAAEHGRLDGLVNNAAVPFRARVHEVELDDWNRVLAVNLTGTLLGIQTAVPLMAEGGSIVNVSSIAGLTGHYAAAYTVSKWGQPRRLPSAPRTSRRRRSAEPVGRRRWRRSSSTSSPTSHPSSPAPRSSSAEVRSHTEARRRSPT